LTILNDIKTTLRVSNTVYDGEISDLIEAAKTDLTNVNINVDKKVTVDSVEVIDPLLKRAIILYCKANFGLNNPDAERLQKSYESLKTHLSLSQEYIIEVVVV
jgi:outer membrane cobalamin receptor